MKSGLCKVNLLQITGAVRSVTMNLRGEEMIEMEPSNPLIQPEEPVQVHPKGYQPRRRKRKFVACLLSALFPGFGHLYLRKFVKGSLFIDFFLIDVALLVYFSSVRMGINLP